MEVSLYIKNPMPLPVVPKRTILPGINPTAPSNLTALTISDTIIDISWTNTTTGEYVINLERRTENGIFTLIQTLDQGVEYFRDTNRLPNTKYYYRAIAFKDGHYSEYSNIVSDWTAMLITLTATGSGVGVAKLAFQSSALVNMTIDGNGKFYDDSAGTINEGISRDITPGAIRLFYLKVTSGSSKLLVFSKGTLTKWGDEGNVGWDTGYAGTNMPTLSMALGDICKSITELYLLGLNTVTGYLSDLPTGLTKFTCEGSNVIAGSIALLPSGLTIFSLAGNNTASGSIETLPSGLTVFHVYGSNTISGSVGYLPSGLTSLLLHGNNTVSGNVSGLPSGLTYLSLYGNNTVTGLFSGLPRNLTQIFLFGSNTVGGAFSGVPSNVVYFYVGGASAASGTFADLPSTLMFFYFMSSVTTTITANTADLPRSVIYFIYSASSLSGTIADLPSGMYYMVVTGANTLSGNIADIPSGMQTFIIVGSNVISGSIADMPAAMNNFNCEGLNTIGGNISGLPSNLSQFKLIGYNTITGDLSSLKLAMINFFVSGNNTISDYTTGHTWKNGMYSLYCAPAAGSGLSSTEIDNILIDLALVTWLIAGSIWLAGNNAARTSASDAAVSTLQGLGVTVSTN